jgi:hypothetical protein
MRLLTLGLILICSLCNGQDTFNLKPRTINETKGFEKSLSSETVGLRFFNPKYDPFYQKNIAVKDSVLIFKRTNDDFYPTLHTWYFYDKDSVVNLIYYHWGFYNTGFNFNEHPGLLEEQTERFKEYSNKFKSIKKNIEKLIGKKGRKAGDNEYMWETESLIISLSMRFDKALREIPVVGKTGDFKIEMRTYFKAGEIANR